MTGLLGRVDGARAAAARCGATRRWAASRQLGAWNVLSVWLPSRDEPIRQRRQSGSLRQFRIAFTAAYPHRYLANFMLIWRVYAAPGADPETGHSHHPGHPDRARLNQHVDTADRLRPGPGPTAEGPPDAAEGDRRRPGQPKPAPWPPNKRPRQQRRRPPRRNGPPEPEAIGPMITTRKLQACHLRRVMPARVPAVRLRKASGCALRGVPDEPVERNDERPSD
jgi:hypothetical protein